MPLARPAIGPPVFETMIGVFFVMEDAAKGEMVKCIISTEALEDVAASLGVTGDQMKLFTALRSKIETAASTEYDRGSIDPTGTERLTSSDALK